MMIVRTYYLKEMNEPVRVGVSNKRRRRRE